MQGVGCRVWEYPLHEVDEALVVHARVVGHEGRVHPEPRLCQGVGVQGVFVLCCVSDIWFCVLYLMGLMSCICFLFYCFVFVLRFGVDGVFIWG